MDVPSNQIMNRLKILKQATGLGLTLCKDALVSSDNDLQKAILLLKNEGHLSMDFSFTKWESKQKLNVLQDAVKNGDIDSIKERLLQGEDPNIFDASYPGPLASAVINNQLEIVKLLLSYQADVNDSFGRRPPLCFSKDAQISRVLLDAGADVDRKDPNGFSPVIAASYNNGYHSQAEKYANIRVLLEAGADINYAGHYGGPIHIAASEGDTKLVDLLVEFKANPDLPDNSGKTAISLAIAGQHWETASRLKELGARTSVEQYKSIVAKKINEPDKQTLSESELEETARLLKEEIEDFAYMFDDGSIHSLMRSVLETGEDVSSDTWQDLLDNIEENYMLLDRWTDRIDEQSSEKLFEIYDEIGEQVRYEFNWHLQQARPLWKNRNDCVLLKSAILGNDTMQAVFALLFFPAGPALNDHNDIFLRCLKHTDGIIRVLAAQILSEAKTDPESIWSDLWEMIQDPNGFVALNGLMIFKKFAGNNLQKILTDKIGLSSKEATKFIEKRMVKTQNIRTFKARSLFVE